MIGLLTLANIVSLTGAICGLSTKSMELSAMKDLLDACSKGLVTASVLGPEESDVISGVLRKASRELKIHYDEILSRESRGDHAYRDEINAAFLSLNDVFDRCIPSPEKVAELGLDPHLIALSVADAAAKHNSDDFSEGRPGRHILISLVEDSYRRLRRSPKFMTAISAANWSLVISNTSKTLAKVESIEENINKSKKEIIDTIKNNSFAQRKGVVDGHIPDLKFIVGTHRKALYSAAFSNSGDLVVLASQDKTAVIYNLGSKEQETRALTHTNGVVYATFSPDDRHVVTASRDKTSVVWNARDGEALSVQRHKGGVNTAVFSSDGRRILTASWGKVAVIWDAFEDDRALTTFKGHKDVVNSAFFSPTDKVVVTASADRTVTLWDEASGTALKTFKFPSMVLSASFDPTGKYVVVALDSTDAEVWSVETERRVYSLKGHESTVWSAAFSPSGRYIVTASEDYFAIIWDVSVSPPTAFKRLQHPGPVITAEFSSCERYVLTACGDCTAKVWEFRHPL